MGRVLELNLADLNNDDDQSYKKVKLCIEEVQGRNCLTDFHGYGLTRDKLNSLMRKWHTMIEAHADVKTTDGYVVRLFVIAFTRKMGEQVKTNCYAQSAQIRKIRAKMMEIMKRTQGIFPLKDVFVRKVKIIKKPKFDITKLMEMHGDGDGDAGVEMLRPETEEAQNLLTASVEAAEGGGDE